MAAALSVLIFGATGATGKHILREVLQSSRFSRVGEYGRSVTAHSNLPSTALNKLEQKTIDFERLDEAELKQGNWDVVLITLGTTRSRAGSAEAFEKIDREYVLNAARAAKSDDPSRKQRLIYVSVRAGLVSVCSNPKSRFLYTRSKGLTESALAGLGYDDVIIFRPGMLLEAHRSDPDLAERVWHPVVTFLSRFSDKIGISVAALGKSIRFAGELGSEGINAGTRSSENLDGHPVTSLNNSQALKLARQFSG